MELWEGSVRSTCLGRSSHTRRCVHEVEGEMIVVLGGGGGGGGQRRSSVCDRSTVDQICIANGLEDSQEGRLRAGKNYGVVLLWLQVKSVLLVVMRR